MTISSAAMCLQCTHNTDSREIVKDARAPRFFKINFLEIEGSYKQISIYFHTWNHSILDCGTHLNPPLILSTRTTLILNSSAKNPKFSHHSGHYSHIQEVKPLVTIPRVYPKIKRKTNDPEKTAAIDQTSNSKRQGGNGPTSTTHHQLKGKKSWRGNSHGARRCNSMPKLDACLKDPGAVPFPRDMYILCTPLHFLRVLAARFIAALIFATGTRRRGEKPLRDAPFSKFLRWFLPRPSYGVVTATST